MLRKSMSTSVVRRDLASSDENVEAVVEKREERPVASPAPSAPSAPSASKWEDDARRLEVLNKSLNHTRHITGKIVDALEQVEERIAQVVLISDGLLFSQASLLQTGGA
jgi:hypothetical protein